MCQEVIWSQPRLVVAHAADPVPDVMFFSQDDAVCGRDVDVVERQIMAGCSHRQMAPSLLHTDRVAWDHLCKCCRAYRARGGKPWHTPVSVDLGLSWQALTSFSAGSSSGETSCWPLSTMCRWWTHPFLKHRRCRQQENHSHCWGALVTQTPPITRTSLWL